MDHPWGTEPVTAGDFGCARGAAVEQTAFHQQFGACGSMNGALHTATPEKRGIGRVHDRVHSLPGNVTLNHFDPAFHNVPCMMPLQHRTDRATGTHGYLNSYLVLNLKDIRAGHQLPATAARDQHGIFNPHAAVLKIIQPWLHRDHVPRP